MTKSAEVVELTLSPLSEELRRNEMEAFQRELSPLLDRARRLAASLLLDAGLADDAVQEAALRAWEKRRNRRPGTDLGPWFLGIVVRRCRESRRSRWARVLRLPDPPAVESGAPDSAAGMDVRRALCSLPEGARLVLALRYYLDLPFAEVSRVLGCSEHTARLRARRAVAALRQAMDATEESP
ncbi:MAG TPA: RNA polymerase sigma factor [Candidatus Binatia bacterium]|nr:RNA polymerase sigma factor [Candidatus Binatia bacterium]